MILDFPELLGRGIIATRSGRFEEGDRFLNLAARVDPRNPRVWLWLAAATDSLDEQRRYLERALEVDQNCHPARWLLDRLRGKQLSLGQPEAGVVRFTCPSCGGKQLFDPDLPGLVCQSCGRPEPMALQRLTESHLELERENDRGQWSIMPGEALCGACGARMTAPPSSAALRCAFCDSVHITVQPATPGLISPAGIAPFRYHEDDVHQLIGKHWGVQPDRVRQLIEEGEISLSGVYLPFWMFGGQVHIRCVLDRRIYPDTYSATERVVLRDSWPRRSAWFECDIADHLVYAAHTLAEEEVRRILPFELRTLYAYNPAILAGWQAEHYQIALEDAGMVAEKEVRDLAFDCAARRGLYMEPSDMLQGDVRVLNWVAKLVLLPVYAVKRNANANEARLLINGQTGKVSRDRSDWFEAWRKWLA